MYMYMYTTLNESTCTCRWPNARVDKEEGRVSNCTMLPVICASRSLSQFV